MAMIPKRVNCVGFSNIVNSQPVATPTSIFEKAEQVCAS
jgi:hypothetical protein